MADIPVSTGTLPSNFCPTNYQDLANGLGAIYSVNTGSGSSATVTISATKPSDTTVVWARIDSLGRFLGIYIYGQGAWLQAHPLQPGATVWWFNALPNFTSYDGGDSGSLGPQSGPMWQQALDYNGNLITAQFLMTPGTLPSGTVVPIGGTGGEETHILVPNEMPPHQHYAVNGDSTQTNLGSTTLFEDYVNSASNNSGYNLTGSTTIPTLAPTSVAGGVTPPPVATGGGIVTPIGYAVQYQAAAHNTLPVFATGFLLQRTSRIFYAVN